MRQLVCDFCNAPEPDPMYECPCRDFSAGVPVIGSARRHFGVPDDVGMTVARSAGGWCACRACANLVRAGNRKGLERRALESIRPTIDPALWDRQRVTFVAEIRRLHANFWANREGPPRELTGEEIAGLRAMEGNVVEVIEGPMPMEGGIERWFGAPDPFRQEVIEEQRLSGRGTPGRRDRPPSPGDNRRPRSMRRPRKGK
jgi:hypothetical protein